MTAELTTLAGQFARILEQARGQVRQSVNSARVASYCSVRAILPATADAVVQHGERNRGTA
jgi:hypothetical protein